MLTMFRQSLTRRTTMAHSAFNLFQMTTYLAVANYPYCDVAHDTTIKMLGTGRRVGFYCVVAFDSSRRRCYASAKGMAQRAVVRQPVTMRKLPGKASRRVDKENGNSTL